MGAADTLIAILGAGVIGLWLYSGGAFNQILGQPQQQQQQQQVPVEVFGKEAEAQPPPAAEESQQQLPEEAYMQPAGATETQYYYAQQPPIYQGPAPPPGMQSSLIPMQTPSGPPYVSQTVGTYSQYSPYNQFRAYQPYQTYPQIGMGIAPDDNTNFSDITTSTRHCRYCRSRCAGNPASYTCINCRPACKRPIYSETPSRLGWDIKAVGTIPTFNPAYPYQSPSYSPYSYLGMVFDYLAGSRKREGAVFTDMDDYHHRRRFDPHNKLRRRVISSGPAHPYVSQEDYYDKQRIAFNIE